MGEGQYTLPAPNFNRSIRVEARPERLTSDAGALLVREAYERTGILDWLTERLKDPRNPDRVLHPLRELLATSLLMLAQGWRDQDDADHLRHDPAFRLGVSSRRGTAPLRAPADDDDTVPDGLASQPTLSRLAAALSTAPNRRVLRDSLVVMAGRRLRAANRGHRRRYLTLDVDSLPVEAHGHQAGAEYNGHYKAMVFHPLIATAAETGDILDTRLRPGRVHTADGALDFILDLVNRAERELCQVASVRIDAGFPSEKLLSGLEGRRLPVHYVARIRNNARLKRLAEPHLAIPARQPGTAPRTWFHEHEYAAGSWSKARRVVLVVQERPGELFPHTFWLITSWDAESMPAEDLLQHYRRRGHAESRFGEWMSVLAPALSSSCRRKSHYRGEEPAERTRSRDPFATNEVILLLNALAYEAMHVLRTLMERATKKGWGLMRLREQLLKVAARLLLHARRVVCVIAEGAAARWALLWAELAKLSRPPPAATATS